MATISKVKKGSTVIMCGFTGMKLGVFEVVAADKDTVTVSTKKGEIVFDRKTAKQIEPEPKAPRFASYLIEDDGSYVSPQRKKKDKSTKETTKKIKTEESEEEKEEEETPAPKKAKKSPAKKAPKKKPEPEPEPDEDDEDWDDEDDEDWDDDEDFEEVE